MKFDEIKSLLGDRVVRVRVTCSNGNKYIKRLFISNDGGFVCECMKFSKSKGYIVPQDVYTNEWVSMAKVGASASVDKVNRMKKRATDAYKMLSESGLWPDIKREIEEFLKLSDEDIRKDFVEMGVYALYQAKKYDWYATYQVFGEFLKDKCWKSISFDKWDTSKQLVLTNVQNAISLKRDFSHRWRNNYDNSLEVNFNKDGIGRAWYSEEYKNCANGHYYLLFDYNHAIFYEDD